MIDYCVKDAGQLLPMHQVWTDGVAPSLVLGALAGPLIVDVEEMVLAVIIN